jgi:hypothetical protein
MTHCRSDQDFLESTTSAHAQHDHLGTALARDVQVRRSPDHELDAMVDGNGRCPPRAWGSVREVASNSANRRRSGSGLT